MTIQQDGNVGIGATSPNKLLHVGGSHGDGSYCVLSKTDTGTSDDDTLVSFDITTGGVSSWASGWVQIRAAASVGNLGGTGYLFETYRWANYDHDSAGGFSITKIGDMSYSGSMKTTYSGTSGNTITWTVAYPETNHDGVTRYMNCTFEAGSYDGVTIA